MGIFSSIRSALAKPPKSLKGVSKSPVFYWLDRFRRTPVPRPDNLIEKLTEVAYFCAHMNASTVACARFRLFKPVSTKPDPRFRPKIVPPEKMRRLQDQPTLKSYTDRALVEIGVHPALTLLNESPSPHFDGFNLIYLAQLAKEVVGRNVWQIEMGGMGDTPSAIWPLLPHRVEPVADETEEHILKGYRVTGTNSVIPLDNLVIMAFPHMGNPYTSVWSPMLAASKSIGLLDLDIGLAWSYMMNRARPDVWISPKEGGGIDDEEVERMFVRLQKIYASGGDGGVMITDQPVNTQTVGFNMKEMDQIRRVEVHTARIMNAFGVPQAMGTTKTNLANMRAAILQYSRHTITPRLITMCQALTRQYIRKWDDTAFIWFDDPVPEDIGKRTTERESMLRTGQRTINEYREEDGLEPVPWGDEPFQPPSMAVSPSITPEDADKESKALDYYDEYTERDEAEEELVNVV